MKEYETVWEIFNQCANSRVHVRPGMRIWSALLPFTVVLDSRL